MANIPKHIVDDILQTARIEDVIGEFVNLKKSGSNLKGLSPFQDERTPSFMVSPSKQIFKCFSSGKGGNVVTFLMEKEHFSYPEALRWLADKYGILIPENKTLSDEELNKLSEKESLFIINEFAKEHFKKNLTETEEGKSIGLSYFVERGFRIDIIEKFQLGYCLNSKTDLTKSALSKGYKLEYLEKTGLTKKYDNNYFDFFHGRVIFPIHSVSGRILGFGGRTLFVDKKIAKYFNSPESSIYNKSEILYGLYFSKSAIIKQNNCFLCEGYTDVISLYQSGIHNVVSSSGTSLTKEQIRLIKRYSENITILYDGDTAGINASFRGIDLILQEGMNVKVVLFPEGEDPDSFAKKVSSSELENYINSSMQDFISFKANILLGNKVEDPLKKAELIKEIVNSVGLIPDLIKRTIFIQEISNKFKIQESILEAELLRVRKNINFKEHRELENEIKNNNEQPKTDELLISSNNFENKLNNNKFSFPAAEYELIRLIVLYGPLETDIEIFNENNEKIITKTSVIEYICNELAEEEEIFETPILNKIHQLYLEGLSNNELYKSSVLKSSENQDIVKLICEIEANEHEISDNWYLKHRIITYRDIHNLSEVIKRSLYAFKLYKIQKKISEINKIIDNENPDEEHIKELNILNKFKIRFSKELGRTILT